jgi:hypothetical protein
VPYQAFMLHLLLIVLIVGLWLLTNPSEESRDVQFFDSAESR